MSDHQLLKCLLEQMVLFLLIITQFPFATMGNLKLNHQYPKYRCVFVGADLSRREEGALKWL